MLANITLKMIAKITVVLLLLGSYAIPATSKLNFEAESASHRVENCGVAPLSQKVRSSIVGGNEATPHSYPWQVQIESPLNISISDVCAGTLISDSWVLSAAHCFNRVHHRRHKSLVTMGAHDRSKIEASTITIRASHLVIHWRYNITGRGFDDIALLKMDKKVSLNDYIRPACLPSRNSDVPIGTMVTATGWGLTERNESSQVLREVTVPIYDQNSCSEQYLLNEAIATTICTDSTGVRGVCIGDSGGPLNYKSGDVTEVIGVTSFGGNCSHEYPDVFTKVVKYLDWIKWQTGIET